MRSSNVSRRLCRSRLPSFLMALCSGMVAHTALAAQCGDLFAAAEAALKDFDGHRGEVKSSGNFRTDLTVLGLGDCTIFEARSTGARISCSVTYRDVSPSGRVRNRTLGMSKADADQRTNELDASARDCLTGQPSERVAKDWAASSSSSLGPGEARRVTYEFNTGDHRFDLRLEIEATSILQDRGEYVVRVSLKKI